ncbi:hypothetical protein CAPTEDRAFT_206383 [Capitella teleta]|uniref:Uncharacterized protein n=1 Tax=Capitella teleta TaxID=283909 RepID=R7TEV8_CAPTE|nr:hypothetical protein CAPTEDRAFT_206383 [Capitella teleta]|eukprot:ELT90012.1 hypothetical protein CAPTEDRAFT_206383 [Capitella teleta]
MAGSKDFARSQSFDEGGSSVGSTTDTITKSGQEEVMVNSVTVAPLIVDPQNKVSKASPAPESTFSVDTTEVSSPVEHKAPESPTSPMDVPPSPKPFRITSPNVELSRIRKDNLAKKRSLSSNPLKLPELSETSETESTKEAENMDSEPDTGRLRTGVAEKEGAVFPSLPDAALEKMGLIVKSASSSSHKAYSFASVNCVSVSKLENVEAGKRITPGIFDGKIAVLLLFGLAISHSRGASVPWQGVGLPWQPELTGMFLHRDRSLIGELPPPQPDHDAWFAHAYYPLGPMRQCVCLH